MPGILIFLSVHCAVHLLHETMHVLIDAVPAVYMQVMPAAPQAQSASGMCSRRSTAPASSAAAQTTAAATEHVLLSQLLSQQSTCSSQQLQSTCSSPTCSLANKQAGH
jgi:hypothetical protein